MCLLRMLPLLCVWFLVAVPNETNAAPNLLRNGSFEGSLLYWHNLEPGDYSFVQGDAQSGAYALKVTRGFLMSAPFVAEHGKKFTVTLSAKGSGMNPGSIHVSMPPSAREEGTKANRLWTKEAGQSAKLTTQWQRFSFSWTADVPASGFWPRPHYLVQIGSDQGHTLFLDSVSVTEGETAPTAYVPRRDVEVLVDCPDLPGYRVNGNLLEKGRQVRVTAHAANFSARPMPATLRWQLFDYEGQRALGQSVEKTVVLGPGESVAETRQLPLVTTGCVLARVSAFAADIELDHSEIPITSLPYPGSSTRPDFRERFGGSFAGGEGMLQKMQVIGFGWVRWFPESKWQNFQPKNGQEFQWFEKEYALSARHGMSSHVVLYGWPKWIMDEPSDRPDFNPLPKDMRWAADDPRWKDFKPLCAWDRFVIAAAEQFRGKSVVFEIANEPEFDHWDNFNKEYALFTLRTARLLKVTDPRAKVMVNNVYGIPSRLNSTICNPQALKDIDVISWHDYHEGWLADARTIRRFRQNLDDAGGKHVEVWFNEGWAYTNTAVDEPVACTSLTSAQSTNQIVASVVEMSVAGQKKTILFHTGYEEHGMSFWDYSGPGTLLWDWYGHPLPLVGAWNVLNHHIGISDEIALVRPPNANCAIFQDLRNNRGVIVAYADQNATADVTLTLPLTGLTVEDNMGNASPLAGTTLPLNKSGRVVFLYDGKKSGSDFKAALESLDRKYASFVDKGTAGAAPVWKLPTSWEGRTKGLSDGSVATADGKPVWKLEQLWPVDPTKRENFRPMVWTGTEWNVAEGGFGGQPAVALKDRTLRFGTRAAHGVKENERFPRTAALAFVAPRAGVYMLGGEAACSMWDGANATQLMVLVKSAAGVKKSTSLQIPNRQKKQLAGTSVALAEGDELVVLPMIEGMFTGGDCQLTDFTITLGPDGAVADRLRYSLPEAWEGEKKNSSLGNPIVYGGQPVWRLDRLWPVDPKMTARYEPMIWDGTKWAAPDHTQSGHPSAVVEKKGVTLAAMGPWGGQELNYPKTGALVFIAPATGTYRLTARAAAKPWEGNAPRFPVAILKKDAQRAAEIKRVELPRDHTPVAIDVTVDLSKGHELLILPLTHDLHNNAVNIFFENVSIERLNR